MLDRIGFEVAVVAVLAGVVVLVGVLRKERPWEIAMSTAGYVAFVAALAWAIRISPSASWPLLLAALGMYLMTTAQERTRRPRERQAAEQTPVGGR